MLLILGWLIVGASVVGGFLISGGHLVTLFVLGEYVVILGVCIGYILAASPLPVLKVMFQKILRGLRGSPYSRNVYIDLVKALYELFMMGREQGVLGIEEHVLQPQTSAIFQKYPSFLHDHHAVAFLHDNLRPLMDGKAKVDQIKEVLEQQLDRLHAHHAQPISVLTKVGDAMPGIGIVAAVLGIIITMASIGGDKAAIGHHVASALTGTFLGILISYGFIQPLTINLEFLDVDEMAYYEVMGHIIVAYAAGLPPVAGAESGRQAIPEDRRPGCEELEALLKGINRKV